MKTRSVINRTNMSRMSLSNVAITIQHNRKLPLLYRNLLKVKGLPNVSNNAQRKKDTVRRRKAPARGSLVARSMRGDVFRKSKSPKQRKLNKSLSINRKSLKLRKAKEKIAAVRKRKLQKPLGPNAPSTSGDNNPMKPKCLEAMADLVNQTKGNSYSYFLRGIKPNPKPKLTPKVQDVQRKLKVQRKPRTTPTLTKKIVDDTTQDWPSLVESSRQKGLIKTAATEIVRNKQSGTLNKLTKQTYAQSVTKTTELTNSGEKSILTQPHSTWASAVSASLLRGTRKDTRFQKSLQECQVKNSKTSRRNVEREINRRLPDSSCRQTIERRRGRSQRQKSLDTQPQSPNKYSTLDINNLQGKVAQREDTLDLTQSTSRGANGQLMWKIDNMPESLRFTKPARNLVSLKENQLEAAKVLNYYDGNKCNNRKICLGDFIADNKTNAIHIRKNQGRGKKGTNHFENSARQNTFNKTRMGKNLVSANKDLIQGKVDLPVKTSSSINRVKDASCDESGLKHVSPDCHARKLESDICSLLDHVSFQKTPVVSLLPCTGAGVTGVTDNETGGISKPEHLSSKKQQKTNQGPEISSPKKISLRYRALLRGSDNHMSPKALTEAVTRKKKDDALRETTVVTRGKRKKQQRKSKQKSFDELRIEHEGCQLDNPNHQNVEHGNLKSFDLVRQQGTSSSFSHSVRHEEPAMSPQSINNKNVLSHATQLTSDGKLVISCDSDDKDRDSDSDNLSIIYQTRQEIKARNSRQAKGVNKIPNVILCDDSDEDEEEAKSQTSQDGGKNLNNSFVKDLRKGSSDYDLLQGDIDMRNKASWSRVSVSRGQSLSDMSSDDVITRAEQTIEVTSCADIDVDWWMMCLFGER